MSAIDATVADLKAPAKLEKKPVKFSNLLRKFSITEPRNITDRCEKSVLD
jgi:hypothetical protein